MKILIVEDEVLLALALEDELTNAGHEIVGVAAWVEKALAVAAASRPDLALVNIDLKHGGSGIDLARQLMDRFNCFSLFVSGNKISALAAQDAAIGFVSKPYDPSVILQSVAVAEKIIQGQSPQLVPRGLMLFRTTLH